MKTVGLLHNFEPFSRSELYLFSPLHFLCIFFLMQVFLEDLLPNFESFSRSMSLWSPDSLAFCFSGSCYSMTTEADNYLSLSRALV